MLTAPLLTVLLDFDGLIADYDHARHLQSLAAACGLQSSEVNAALRGDGLELAHARGELDGKSLLQALNQRLDVQLQASDWHAARMAATRIRNDVRDLLSRVRPGVNVAVLTNNGLLTRPVIEQLLPDIRVLCSAELGVRKPDPNAYLAACTAMQSAAARSLFVDHLFRNVQGARAAGLHADTAYHAQSLRKLLKRYQLL